MALTAFFLKKCERTHTRARNQIRHTKFNGQKRENGVRKKNRFSEEFVKLFQVSMSKSCVAVTVRIKPLDHASQSCGIRELNGTTLQVPKQLQSKPSVSSAGDNRDFKVDGILGEKATQEECFQAVTAPLIHSLLDGYNGTVLAYGQTGTMLTLSLFFLFLPFFLL
jgi:hypothetical protein